MSTFTLDDIRAAADKQYASTTIAFGDGDSVSLLNAIRLPKPVRDQLLAIQDELNEAAEDVNVDQAALLEKAIRLVAEDRAAANRLLKAVGGDLGVLAVLFEKYNEGTEMGEASASHD